jgi:hypothetical protein
MAGEHEYFVQDAEFVNKEGTGEELEMGIDSVRLGPEHFILRKLVPVP